VLAAANSQALWYLTRATGLVTLLLLTGSVVLGILGANRWSSKRWPRFVTSGLHKNLSLLAVAFLVVHIVTAVTDSFVTITWVNVFVPFTGSYRPVWLGLGAVASDLLIALIVTSIARRYIGYRAWRAVHWAAYACWPIALVHGLGTGSDARRGWALAVFLGCLAVVCGAVWWRLTAGGLLDAARRRAGALVASAAVPVVILAWLAAGPLQPGWAAKAGTPVTTTTAPSSSVLTPVANFASPFTASLSGSATETQSAANASATVTMSATVSGQASGKLVITIIGSPAPSGGVTMTSSTATLGPVSQPSRYRGHVVLLDGDQLVLRLTAPSSAPVYATVNVVVNAAGTLTGTIQTSASPPA